tara:strand:+ start:1080 stop:1310 length:231 start_codon:yes stop_codon:yes gene_type:complete
MLRIKLYLNLKIKIINAIMNKLTKAKNTGIGAVEIGQNYVGRRHIRFDNNGNYPYGSIEYIMNELDLLKKTVDNLL